MQGYSLKRDNLRHASLPFVLVAIFIFEGGLPHRRLKARFLRVNCVKEKDKIE